MDCILRSYLFYSKYTKNPSTKQPTNTINTCFRQHSVKKLSKIYKNNFFCLHHCRNTLVITHCTSEWPAYGQQTGFIWLDCVWRGMLLLRLLSTPAYLCLPSRLLGESRQCARAPRSSFGTGLRKKQKHWNKLRVMGFRNPVKILYDLKCIQDESDGWLVR